MAQNIRVNNQIRANEVRVVDEEGKNLGVFPLTEALTMAEERGVDLVEIAEKAIPPIVKLINHGKYLYIEQKKAKKQKGGHKTEIKSLQIKIATGEHDLLLKAKKAAEFLEEGHRVKIELFLPGRAKYLNKNFLQERLTRFINLIKEPYKIADGPKQSPKGLTLILERDKPHEK